MTDEELTAPHDGRRIQIAPRRRRPRHQAEVMSEHVLYEIEAFGALDELVGRRGRFDERDFPVGSEDWWLGNTIAEAFFLHVRTLDEFIYGDVIAADKGVLEPINLRNATSALDFVADSQAWLDERQPRPVKLRRRRINRTIAHLTWDRVEPGWEEPGLGSVNQPHQKEQTWPVPEMWHALRPALVLFLEHLDQGAVCADFAERADLALTGRAIT